MAAPRMSPRLAPESDEPYSAMACFSSSISRALTDRVTLRAPFSIRVTLASIFSPTANFSVLKPKTRIPPHTGVANFRLVTHLPLILPPSCGFRVGSETREWRIGEAWVFDDTIEHEAWNDSDETRVILICDIWNPRLSEDERRAIAAVIAATDTYNGTVPPAHV